MNPIRKLPGNNKGRDFVMGDVHGHVDMLHTKLNELSFDPGVDRLFSVGDLIDRGPDSLQVLMLLDEPWFYPVLGNHEAMMIDYCMGKEKFLGRWFECGADWASAHDQQTLVNYAKKLESLPMIMEVGEGEQLFCVVHAEYPRAHRYPLFSLTESDVDVLLWSRSLHRAYERYQNGVGEYKPVELGLPLTFCGHTAVNEPGFWRSHYLLDTGCGWWSDGELTVIEVNQIQKVFRDIKAKYAQ